MWWNFPQSFQRLLSSKEEKSCHSIRITLVLAGKSPALVFQVGTQLLSFDLSNFLILYPLSLWTLCEYHVLWSQYFPSLFSEDLPWKWRCCEVTSRRQHHLTSLVAGWGDFALAGWLGARARKSAQRAPWQAGRDRGGCEEHCPSPQRRKCDKGGTEAEGPSTHRESSGRWDLSFPGLAGFGAAHRDVPERHPHFTPSSSGCRDRKSVV